jgi:hypothetical protein
VTKICFPPRAETNVVSALFLALVVKGNRIRKADIDYKKAEGVLVLSRFSSGLFRAMFAMKEIENGKEDRRVPPRCG